MNKIEQKARELAEKAGFEWRDIDFPARNAFSFCASMMIDMGRADTEFCKRPKGHFVIGEGGAVLYDKFNESHYHYNDWQSKEFAELVSADQRRRYAMWQAVYMFDPESKGRGRHYFDMLHGEWVPMNTNISDNAIGVNSADARQNCIDWLTEQGV